MKWDLALGGYMEERVYKSRGWITQSAAKVQSTRGGKETTPFGNLENQRSGAHGGITQAATFLLAHLPLSNGIACVFRNWITILLTNKENGATFI